MFGSGLRNLDCPVCRIHDLLRHAVHLVTEHQGVFLPRSRPEFIQHDGSFDLLHDVNEIPLRTQRSDAVGRRGEIVPRNGQLGSERRLVDLPVGRGGGDAAQGDAFDGKGVRRAEKAPTFCIERTLSSTTATGIFSIRANSPAEGRPSSSLVIFLIVTTSLFSRQK